MDFGTIGAFGTFGSEMISGARRGFAVKANREMKEAGFELRKIPEKKCPYSEMAKDGIIEYNDLIFVCDYKHNAITLGDMSDEKRVLKISLPSGGSLKVNVDNIGDISKAAGMFTPEDLEAIMRAIHEYNHCTRKLNEIEEEESETVEEAAERNAETESDTEPEYSEESTIAYINSFRTELYYKLINNETETKYRIGSQELTLKEWDKMISDFDEKQDYVREAMREEVKDRISDEDREEMIRKLFEDRDELLSVI